jgi:hypothetical protein
VYGRAACQPEGVIASDVFALTSGFMRMKGAGGRGLSMKSARSAREIAGRLSRPKLLDVLQRPFGSDRRTRR